MYSLICANTDNIYYKECIFTKLDRFTRFYGFDGIFGNTTSTLKVPLIPVGLLLKLMSKAMRCLLLLMKGEYAFLFRTRSTLFSLEDQVLKFLCFGSICSWKSFFIWVQV